MARGRKRQRGRWLFRSFLLLLLVALAGASYLWWKGRSWVPDAAVYPDQGALIGADSGSVNFRTLRALGAGFVYLYGSDGAEGQDPSFAQNFETVGAIGMQVGVVHRFDPCVSADEQSANFVVMVPRDAQLLPPAIELERTHDTCPGRISEASVESELLTLINQIELHSGRPVILKPGRAFERRYGFASRIERNLWLTQSWAEPGYAGRPWLLWTANTALRTEASEEPIGWVVVQP